MTVQGQSEIITLTATVNGKPLVIENGIFSLTDLKAGEYVFSFTAEDSREKTSTIQKTITVLDEELEKGTDRDEAMLIAFENVTGKKVEIA